MARVLTLLPRSYEQASGAGSAVALPKLVKYLVRIRSMPPATFPVTKTCTNTKNRNRRHITRTPWGPHSLSKTNVSLFRIMILHLFRGVEYLLNLVHRFCQTIKQYQLGESNDCTPCKNKKALNNIIAIIR